MADLFWSPRRAVELRRRGSRIKGEFELDAEEVGMLALEPLDHLVVASRSCPLHVHARSHDPVLAIESVGDTETYGCLGLQVEPVDVGERLPKLPGTGRGAVALTAVLLKRTAFGFLLFLVEDLEGPPAVHQVSVLKPNRDTLVGLEDLDPRYHLLVAEPADAAHHKLASERVRHEEGDLLAPLESLRPVDGLRHHLLGLSRDRCRRPPEHELRKLHFGSSLSCEELILQPNYSTFHHECQPRVMLQ